MRVLSLLCLVAPVLLAAPGTAGAQDVPTLRYAPETGEMFMYRYQITVDKSDETVTYSGTTEYTAQASDGSEVKLRFSGHLSSATRQKNRRGGPGRFPFGGPPMIRPPVGPFASRSGPQGLSPTSADIVLTPSGGVKKLGGESQLPYVMGNLSLMPFEPLPDSAQQKWTVATGVNIEEKREDDRFFVPPPLLNRFGGEQKETSAASESAEYTIQQSTPQAVTVHKTFRLDSPNTETKFHIAGEGVWTFDPQRKMPKSLDFKQRVTIKDGATTTTYPMHLTYSLLSAEEHEKLIEQRRKLAEEAKRKADEAKAWAEAPIEGQELAELIAGLSGEDATVRELLDKLAKKNPVDNPHLAAAIQPLLEHPDAKLAGAAKAALARFDLKFKRSYDLNRAYGGFFPLGEVGPDVSANTPLPAGLIVAVSQHRQHYAGEVLKELDDGKVQVKMIGGGRRTVTVGRDELKLAPREVDQANVEPALVDLAYGSKAAAEMRTWQDVTKTFKFTAKLISSDEESVVLQSEDGGQKTVPLAKLCTEDREYVAAQRKAAQPENPFK